MKIPTKKLKDGFEMSSLALGTWMMGGNSFRDENYTNEEQDILAIREAFKLGIRRFDTAEEYGQGYAEEILGKSVKNLNRSDLFITSKVHARNLNYGNVLKSAESSLKRLQMDYLDLYLIHAPNPDIPIEETMKALDELKEEGKIKNIGVSNFRVESFKKAQKATRNKIVLNQVHYNLIFREPIIDGLLDYCRENDIFFEAWRPVQQGNLSRPGINILDKMSKKYGKTQSQIAINWLTSQENVITLVKTSNVEHLKEDLGAIGWEMSKEDVEKLAKEFPIQLKRSNAVKLR